MAHLTTAVAVVEKLGGIKAVAALTGREYNAAQNWKSFGHFPRDTFLVLRKALEDAGYTAPAKLWKMPEP